MQALWISLGIYVCSMDIHYNPTDIHGNPMDILRTPWISIQFLWISIGPTWVPEMHVSLRSRNDDLVTGRFRDLISLQKSYFGAGYYKILRHEQVLQLH